MREVSWVRGERREWGRDMLAEKSGDVKSVGEDNLRCGRGGGARGEAVVAFVAVRRTVGVCHVSEKGRRKINE